MLANMTAMGAVDIARSAERVSGPSGVDRAAGGAGFESRHRGALVNGRRADWRDTDTDTDTGVPARNANTAPRGRFCPSWV